MPRKFILWVILGFAVLGIGGLAAEHFVGNAGVGTLVTTPLATLAGTPTRRRSPTPPHGPSVAATPAAVIGLRSTSHRSGTGTGPDRSARGPWTLARARAVVVVTFLNAECNDICPVLGSEITQADRLLGTRASAVRFVVVNTDPLETSLAWPPGADQHRTRWPPQPDLPHRLAPDLSAVWKAYGVTVALSNTTRLVTHNDPCTSSDPRAGCPCRPPRSATRTPPGVFSLDPATVHTFAPGRGHRRRRAGQAPRS